MVQCINGVQNYPLASKDNITADVAKNVFEVANLWYNVLIDCKVTLLQIKLVLLQM
jgi:hypothetical protein